MSSSQSFVPARPDETPEHPRKNKEPYRWIQRLRKYPGKVARWCEQCAPWVRRNKAFLSVVGSFVLVGTFLVREVLRETQKDVRDSVQMASTTLNLRADINGITEQLFRIQERQDRSQSPT